MKKILLILFLFNLSITMGKAQSLKIIKPDGSPIVNDTVHILTSDVSSDIEAPLFVKNISDKSKDVWVKLYVKQSVVGSSVLYCWNNCFDIATNVSTNYLTVEAGDTIKDFHSTLTPNDLTGITEIMYTFFVNKDSDDSVSVTITYDILTTGIDNFSEIKGSINSYPNPVQNTLNIKYNIYDSFSANITIYNIVGKQVKKKEVFNTENKTQLDVSGLNPGMYIWAFEIDGIPIKTQKFIKND